MLQATARMADFDLSEEQRQVRQFVKEFAENEILPHVEEYEREEKYPLDLIAKLGPLGLMGPMIPEQYGGSFSDVMSYGIICEELARIDWVVASAVSVANSLAASSIINFGSEEQKQRWLPGIASGETLCSALLTEPGMSPPLQSGRSDAVAELIGPNHFFVPRDEVPYKFELGGASHEGCAGHGGGGSLKDLAKDGQRACVPPAGHVRN